MRAVAQRVTGAAVRVDDDVVGSIGPGWCLLVGVGRHDGEAQARALAAKVWHLRAFPGPGGPFDLPVGDVGGAVLVVSQFTLLADTSRGRRPSWAPAAPGEEAEPLVAEVAAELTRLGAVVATGRFGAHMDVELVNDGPVTLVLEV